MIYSGDKDENLEKSIKKVVEKWGGPFEIDYEKNWKKIIKKWKGKILHLTMYGLQMQNVMNEIKKCKKDLLVLIGSQHVPGEVYHLSDWNVSVTNQPHSEVAALAVFLDRFFEGKELKKDFENKKIKIIPQEHGKKVLKVLDHYDKTGLVIRKLEKEGKIKVINKRPLTIISLKEAPHDSLGNHP
jgi:tRNA (cytidine56-2'-O)-methyltransferase